MAAQHTDRISILNHVRVKSVVLKNREGGRRREQGRGLTRHGVVLNQGKRRTDDHIASGVMRPGDSRIRLAQLMYTYRSAGCGIDWSRSNFEFLSLILTELDLDLPISGTPTPNLLTSFITYLSSRSDTHPPRTSQVCLLLLLLSLFFLKSRFFLDVPLDVFLNFKLNMTFESPCLDPFRHSQTYGKGRKFP